MNLHGAVEKGNLERVRFLVERGADKDKGNHHGFTPLYITSYYGHLEVVQYLVEQGASLDKATNGGWTPLSGAACRGHLEVVRYLLEQGADRDKAGNDGWTPLHFATEYNRLEIATLLMSYGADLNARTSDDRLPIDVARTEEMKHAICDEPRRRMDHGHKRATEQDRHPNTVTTAAHHENEEEGELQHRKNRSHRDEGAAVGSEVTEEDENCESSSDEAGTD